MKSNLKILSVVLFTLACQGSVFAAPAIQKQDGEKIVYCDGVYDLAHYGHAKSYGKARKCAAQKFNVAPEKIKVLVGVCDNDGNLKAYKREPIFNLEQRVNQVLSFKGVDAVIPNAPMAISEGFINEQDIDLVVHGDDFNEEKINKYYGVAVRLGKFSTFPYEDGISTSYTINKATQSTLKEASESSKYSSEEQEVLKKALEILNSKK